MAKPQRFTAAQVIAAVQHTRGMLTLAAERLGCSDETIYNYARRYPSIAEAIKRERERTTDLAELRLYNAINDGEAWAIQFYLKTQGRTRGYVERQDIRVEISHAAAKVAEEFGMTAEEVLAEAEALIREGTHAG